MIQALRTATSPSALRGAGLEIAWLGAHAVLYPMGVVAERMRVAEDRFSLTGLPPVQRGLLIGDVVAAGTPIVLVHGLVDNRSVFTMLRRSLRRRGFGRVVTLNYSVRTQSVQEGARKLGELVERLCAETGYERVHVIGHSLGGLIARYYVQCQQGDERVHTLVTLGTPHTGTRAARLLPQRLVRQLRPGSDLMTELEAPAPGCRTRFVAFWSDVDQLIHPKSAARVDHPDLTARNIALQGVGHLSLPVHGRVVHEIATTLAHLDEDGQTVTPGVTAIDAEAPEVPEAPVPSAPVGAAARRPRQLATPLPKR